MTSNIARITDDLRALPDKSFVKASGRVKRFDGQVLECGGFPVSVGSICGVSTASGQVAMAEVIGFRDGRNMLFLYDLDARIELGAQVTILDPGNEIEVGPEILGRVIDALGAPLDERGPLKLPDRWPLMGRPLNP
jgi:flagellum-specific ATP synthase